MGNAKDVAREVIDSAKNAVHSSLASNAAAIEARIEKQRKQARSEKLKSDWKKTKEKSLKAVRNGHVVGPLIAMLFMPVIFIVATLGIMFVYFTIVSTGWTNDAVLKYTIMGHNVIDSIEAGLDSSEINYTKYAREAGFDSKDSIAIFDSDTDELVYASGDVEFDESGTETLSVSKKGVGDVNTTLLLKVINSMIEKKSFAKTMSEFSKVLNDRNASVAQWLDEDAISFSDWITDDYFDEGVRIYVYTSLNMNNEQVLTVYLIIAFAAIMSLIPFLFYLFGSIRNYVNWRRTRNVYYYDPVCLCRNWQYLSDQSKRVLKKASKGNKKYAMVSLHMDKYKNYCICYGKEDGEWLLWKIAHLLITGLGKGELCARNSGAEFGLLLKLSDRESMEERITGIMTKLKEIVPERNVSLGCGIAEITDGMQTVDDWFYYAGIAGSTIDENNIKRLVWYDDEMRNERLWVKHVEERMYQALENNEFQVYVQPKHNPVNDEMTGGEALIRWNSPDDGFIVPGRFIPIFEENGFITNIDNFMVSSVAQLQSKWLSQGLKIVPISVNLSRAHFAEPNLAEQICALVDQYNVPHDKIELEITESAFFDDKEALLTTVRKLKDMGFEISMDDFGTGYSSMNSLRELPLDVLKLDAGFFRGNQEDGRGAIVVEDAIRLAKHLNMQVVAEGVEKKDQVDFLAERDCDMVQGYFYAKPMPASEFEERLAQV